MLGAIAGLEALRHPCQVRLISDSQYLVKGMTEWIDGWQRKGWKNTKKEEVANRDLWERLLDLAKKHQVEWVWVKGHDGHLENERCDELARLEIIQAAENIEKGLKKCLCCAGL